MTPPSSWRDTKKFTGHAYGDMKADAIKNASRNAIAACVRAKHHCFEKPQVVDTGRHSKYGWYAEVVQRGFKE